MNTEDNQIKTSFKINGISYRYNNVINFIYGVDQRIYLKKEYNKKIKDTAIKVMGKYIKDGKLYTSHIGYVPLEIKDKLINCVEYDVKIVKIWYPDKDFKYPGVKISVEGFGYQPYNYQNKKDMTCLLITIITFGGFSIIGFFIFLLLALIANFFK